MPVPAVPVAPLAVLVLAWDEATPAVRTLLAAVRAEVSAIDSILMLVPQAEAPTTPSGETPQLLPPATIPELAEPLPSATASAETKSPPAEAPENALTTVPELLASPALPSPPPATRPPAAAASETRPLAELRPTTAAVAPAWEVVRVLRLSSFSLPELAQRAGQPLPAPAWLAATEHPAAPYLGTTMEASQPAPVPTPAPATTAADAPTRLAAQLPDASLATAPTYLPAEPAALAADPEADLLPIEADELASFEAAPAHLLPADNLLTIDELAPAATAPNSPPAPEQAGWPEALAALRHPAPLAPSQLPPASADGLPAADEAELLPLVRPASRSYLAPDLNFQVIQYARFAVPLALADQSFEAIYAPAWPTWLAAQELRQRTGRPLVLHVSSLAAPADESLNTAAGWGAELQRQALRRADLVLAETTALAQRLCRELGLPESAVRTIAATDAAAIAQALRTVQPRAKVSSS